MITCSKNDQEALRWKEKISVAPKMIGSWEIQHVDEAHFLSNLTASIVNDAVMHEYLPAG